MFHTRLDVCVKGHDVHALSSVRAVYISPCNYMCVQHAKRIWAGSNFDTVAWKQQPCDVGVTSKDIGITIIENAHVLFSVTFQVAGNEITDSVICRWKIFRQPLLNIIPPSLGLSGPSTAAHIEPTL